MLILVTKWLLKKTCPVFYTVFLIISAQKLAQTITITISKSQNVDNLFRVFHSKMTKFTGLQHVIFFMNFKFKKKEY